MIKTIIFSKKFSLFLFIFILNCSTIFSATVYKNNVTASYYAEQFHGKKTSNGERFNMFAYTCAHKSLPFNTIIKVTNLRNGKTVNVRVNDRGPFVVGREIDLSKAAAVSLGMIGSGTTKVKLEIEKMGPYTKQSNQTALKAEKMMAKIEGKTYSSKTVKPIKIRQAGTKWDVQVGAFSSKTNANTRAQKLLKDGFTNVIFQTVKSTGVVRVVIKEVDGRDMPELEKQLRQKGYTEYTIRQRLIK